MYYIFDHIAMPDDCPSEFQEAGPGNNRYALDRPDLKIIMYIIINHRPVYAMVKLKIRAVGTSAGVILPKEALAHLGVREGDELFLVEQPDGYKMTPYDPDFEAQLESARKGMDAYRNTLRELAK